MIVATALMCLSLNLFHEARGESIMGRYAVALVTMNRAEKEKDQVCEEVFKRKQFSWTSEVKRTKQGWLIPPHLIPAASGNVLDEISWDRAKRIAKQTLSGKMIDFTQGAKHYHADYVSPKWAGSMTRVKKIGQHIFYVNR